MGLNVRIYDIVSDGPYSIRYKSGSNPWPEYDNTTFTLYGTGLTATTIELTGLTFDTQYWIKMTDETTGRYIIKNIYTHDSKAFPCYDTICFSVDVVCVDVPTPTPTSTTVATSTPTATPTSTPTLTPTLTASPEGDCVEIYLFSAILQDVYGRDIKVMYYPITGSTMISVEYDQLTFEYYLGGVRVFICTTNTSNITYQYGTDAPFVKGSLPAGYITETVGGICTSEEDCIPTPTQTPTQTVTRTLTRTPTPTPTLTRTPTSTTQPITLLGRTMVDGSDASTACSTYFTVRSYIAAPGKTLSTLNNGDIIYDSYPATPTNGGGLWVALTTGGVGPKRAFQIASNGEILDSYNCP